MQLDDAIEQIKIFTKPQVAALKKLGLTAARDLLLYFPRRYLDFSQIKKIKDLTPGENASIKVTVKQISRRFSFRSRMSLAEAVVSDDTGSLKVVWFNQGYVADQLQKGDEVFLAGAPEIYNFSLQLTNPTYEKVSDFPLHTSRLVPLYPRLPEKVYPKTFRRAIGAVLNLADSLTDNLPADILRRQRLLPIADTVKFSHFPDDAEKLAEAKARLAFEEIFYNQLLAQKHKLELAVKQAYPIKFDQTLIKNFVLTLPFELTPAQKKAAWEILQDLEKPRPMNRLLEGDVGSGKTLVALIAALQAISDDYQAVFLAPTEILARQHFETTKKYLLNITSGQKLCSTALLTNSFSLDQLGKIQKSNLTRQIAEGRPGLYIGTHALLQKKVKFKNLALVIIDEQHRFGVEQRAELMKTSGKVPHLLSLSATPIPRTLQLAFYGELDISQIKMKPLGRKAIVTKLVEHKNRGQAYEFIANQINTGRQVFVITPLIEESDKLGVKAAKTELKNLKKVFPKFNIGLMHGRLKGAEKESVMKDFLENKIQILVSTSVVEVGVDIPNASVMVIEGAERFGLAQLHQFRGRVGRAEHQSYCFLFMSPTTPSRLRRDTPPQQGGEAPQLTSNNPRSLSFFSKEEYPAKRGEVVGADVKNDTIARLESFTKTQDGFELAELDLKTRGFGEVYGSQQSGWNFKYFNPSYTSLIEPARQEALAILKDDLNLDNYPLLKEKIAGKSVHFE